MCLNTKYLTKAGLIAALYVVLVLIEIPFGQLAFDPIQLRIAEGLTLLPIVETAAIPGVFVGCLVANFVLTFTSGFGLIDVIGGSLVTLAAAYLTSKTKNRVLGVIPPVVLNGLVISIWVSYFTKIPYWYTVAGISAGELISVAVFGNIMLIVYEKASKAKK